MNFLTENEMILKAKCSPAISFKCYEKGDGHYPHNWFGKVPLKVQMATTVRPDLPYFIPTKPGTVCKYGCEYYVHVNSHGAISAILPNGETLGLRPSEFLVTEWHIEK